MTEHEPNQQSAFGRKIALAQSGSVAVVGDYNHISLSANQVASSLQKPPRTTPFFGREYDISEILASLKPGHTVTVSGPGGIGKSALVSEVIWRLAPEEKTPAQFQDGIIYFSFYDESRTDVVLEHIARSLGELPVPTPKSAVLRALATRAVLIVLDGAEKAENLNAVLTACGSASTLITTRNKRDASYLLLELGPLEIEESFGLLQEVSNYRFARDDIGQSICTLLGNMPLAIRLAARFVARQNLQEVDFLKWLRTETPLTALNEGQRQHQSIELLIEKSIEHITPEAYEVLSIFGLLAYQPLTREVVAASFDLQSASCIRILSELIDYNILTVQDENYQLSHSLLHAFVGAYLEVPVQTGLRLATYFFDLFSNANRIDAVRTEELDPNKRHALHLYFALTGAKQWEAVLRLGWAIRSYIARRGHVFEWSAVAGNALTAAIELGDKFSEAAFMAEHGHMSNANRNHDKAAQLYFTAAGIFREHGFRDHECRQVANAGNALFLANKKREAVRCHRKALEMAEELEDRPLESAVKYYLAADFLGLGQLKLAYEYGVDALEAANETKDELSVAGILSTLALIKDKQGEYQEAIHFGTRSIELARKLGNKRAEQAWSGNVGAFYTELGKFGEAKEHFENAYKLAKAMGDKQDECQWAENLGHVFIPLGDKKLAKYYLNQSLELAHSLDLGTEVTDQIHILLKAAESQCN